jgi:hypothetical protein
MQILKKDSQSYDYGHYWRVQYKETRSNGEKNNFKTIIYCRSKTFALKILKKKTKEDNPGATVSCVEIQRIGAHSRFNDKKLSINDWFYVRNASFPNEVNVLFKK